MNRSLALPLRRRSSGTIRRRGSPRLIVLESVATVPRVVRFAPFAVQGGPDERGWRRRRARAVEQARRTPRLTPNSDEHVPARVIGVVRNDGPLLLSPISRRPCVLWAVSTFSGRGWYGLPQLVRGAVGSWFWFGRWHRTPFKTADASPFTVVDERDGLSCAVLLPHTIVFPHLHEHARVWEFSRGESLPPALSLWLSRGKVRARECVSRPISCPDRAV